jgi:hypothetical protein
MTHPLPLLATSLYEDPSAGLHEDASARLREHPVLLCCSILRRPSQPSSVGGHQDPAGGYERRHRGHHRERPDFRDTALRASCRFRASGSCNDSPGDCLQIRQLCASSGGHAVGLTRHGRHDGKDPAGRRVVPGRGLISAVHGPVMPDGRAVGHVTLTAHPCWFSRPGGAPAIRAIQVIPARCSASPAVRNGRSPNQVIRPPASRVSGRWWRPRASAAAPRARGPQCRASLSEIAQAGAEAGPQDRQRVRDDERVGSEQRCPAGVPRDHEQSGRGSCPVTAEARFAAALHRPDGCRSGFWFRGSGCGGLPKLTSMFSKLLCRSVLA